jgi:hypothetical protein
MSKGKARQLAALAGGAKDKPPIKPKAPPPKDDDDTADDDEIKELLGGKLGALKAALGAVHAGDREKARKILEDVQQRISDTLKKLGGDEDADE